jgi:2-polyprenyl-6-methoxyphenol hydroxylase-like FAD-dependent oxidoreductase
MDKTQKTTARYDVAIIGAGPVGAVAAYAYAKRGRQVCLLEANPRAAARFAGEWLHPSGKQMLDELGMTPIDAAEQHVRGRGFVVFPDDGSEAIELPYVEGSEAITCHHEHFVTELRDQARAHPNVDYRPYVRASNVEPGSIECTQVRSRETERVEADLVVGADGRSSVARKALEEKDNQRVVSYMGALKLRDFQLPHEGFGHVILGGPGPALMYRITPDIVRVSLDVPLEGSDLRRDDEALFEAFRPVLPDWAKPAIRRAIDQEGVQWAATCFRPHVEYGHDGIALVGDAVGSYHPMTAMGMTSGFQDVAALVDSPDLDAYRNKRARASYVPELLSSALYNVFQGEEKGAAPLRKAVYRTWRADPDLCQRTMRLLSGSETRGWKFAATFFRIALRAGLQIGQTALDEHGAAGLGEATRTLAPWVSWPLAPLLPDQVKQRVRPHSSIESPFAGEP